MKKFISVLLATLMIFGVFVTGASAESVTSGNCGENVNWSFDESTNTLTISGTGYMADYAWDNEPPWYDYLYFVNTVKVLEGVKSIGNHAFSGFEVIKTVELPEGLEKIGSSAFGYCFRMDKIEIPSTVKSIGSSAFSECDSIESITLPEGITKIEDHTFSGCYSLKNINIHENITSIGDYAFYMSGITNITIPASVTSIGDNAFLYCGSLTGITVDQANTMYSSDEYGVFFNKDKTELIQYPKANERTEYIIPSGVTLIKYAAFDGSENLINIYIPKSVKTIKSCNLIWSINITDIYYEGTEEEWKAITIEDYNEKTETETIHYNCDVWGNEDSENNTSDNNQTPSDGENDQPSSNKSDYLTEIFMIAMSLMAGIIKILSEILVYIINSL